MLPIAILLGYLPWLLSSQRQRLSQLRYRPSESRDVHPPLAMTVILELLIAALQTGVSIPRALKAVGSATSGSDGARLVKAGRQLELGASWEQAWRNTRPELLVISDALRMAWEVGASPTASLRAAGEAAQRRQLENSKLAAARLSVRLVLPLGLCLLPAFVLIGLVPVLLSLGTGLFS